MEPDKSASAFRAEVHSALRRFIDADWKIQSVQRSQGNQFESVYVQAVARVPEKENYQLAERAKKVSKVGFEVIQPTADYSLTFDELQQVDADLRLILMKKALAECVSLNNAFSDTKGHKSMRYRVSSSRFDQRGNMHQTNNASAYAMSQAIAASASPPGGGNAGVYMAQQVENDASAEAEPADDFNVASRFTMLGHFVLRAFADE